MTIRTLSGPSENMLRTYVALGRHAPSSRLLDDPEFVACTGELDHAICNFATRLRLGPDGGTRLARIAAGRKVFNVYSMPEDAVSETKARLHEVGFRRAYSLVQMTSTDRPSAPIPELESAVDGNMRREIAAFMVSQFFRTMSPGVRDAVASATASAVRLQLFGLFERNELVGAAMAYRAGSCMGLYNLCVSPERQNCGYGTSIVHAIQAKSADFGLPTTLQCDARLERWYQRLGFRSNGTVEVMCLSKRANDAIIK
ncbi:MAG: GNAT family N-acetyltransferase [Fimbriimonadaceae bacterium]